MTQEQLAGILFHSLRDKVMTLADDVVVYPAHGAGSACGKNMSKETVSTIGEQKQQNYALRANMTEAEFIKEVTDGLLPPPAYFGMNVAMNKKGIPSFASILNSGMKAIDASNFEQLVDDSGALILDTRNASDFSKGFVPQSINIGISGDFAPWVGALIADVNQPIVLVTDFGKEEETVTRLSRVGFDAVLGHLKGGFEAWKSAGFDVDTVHRITATQFENEVKIGESKVVDIRRESEYEAEHIEDAYSKPLAYINDWLKDINPNEHFFMHCAGGYRSMIAASILQARGYRNFSEIEGGFNAIAATNLPKTDFMCASKVL
jgi:rhodanese-related sulfurtransferase